MSGTNRNSLDVSVAAILASVDAEIDHLALRLAAAEERNRQLNGDLAVMWGRWKTASAIASCGCLLALLALLALAFGR